MRTTITTGLLGAVLSIMATGVAPAQTSPGSSVSAAGGVTAANGRLRSGATVGQPIVGVSVGGGRIGHGFWHGRGAGNIASAASVPGLVDAVRPALQCFPNPFTGIAEIEVTVPASQSYTITIHDARGATVGKPIHGSAGYDAIRRVRLDATGMASGVYTALLDAGRTRLAIPIVLVR
jgi:hypothetical protein